MNKITLKQHEVLTHIKSMLAEHFDASVVCVSILADGGSTYMESTGTGNYYARIGMCSEFVNDAKRQTEIDTDRRERPSSSENSDT